MTVSVKAVVEKIRVDVDDLELETLSQGYRENCGTFIASEK
ncbi:MAG: hypothetical protein ACI8RD_004685 [Bacillariaceae sp.]|jgi:hypothetical protein